MRKFIKQLGYGFLALLCACGNEARPTATAVRETVIVVITATAVATTVLATATEVPAVANTVEAVATATRVVLPTRRPTVQPTKQATARPAPTDPPPLALDSEVPGGAYAVKILYQRVATTGLVFRVVASRKKGKPDGDGIKNVEFIVTNDQGDVVYRHTENTNPYCGFQESEGSTCRIIPIGPGAKWYKTNNLIGKGRHTLEIIVHGKDDNQLDASVDFEIQ